MLLYFFQCIPTWWLIQYTCRETSVVSYQTCSGWCQLLFILIVHDLSRLIYGGVYVFILFIDTSGIHLVAWCTTSTCSSTVYSSLSSQATSLWRNRLTNTGNDYFSLIKSKSAIYISTSLWWTFIEMKHVTRLFLSDILICPPLSESAKRYVTTEKTPWMKTQANHCSLRWLNMSLWDSQGLTLFERYTLF